MAFKVTGGRGFHITFPNGVTVSVQFGGGTYSEHHDHLDAIGLEREQSSWESPDAEVAVWDRKGWITAEYIGADDQVMGWQSPEQVLALLNWAAKRKES